ncbi:hypothetical protein [Blastococcus sp. SYSU DS0541]
MHRKPLIVAALAAPLALAVAAPAAAEEVEAVVVLDPVGDGGAAGEADLVLDDEAQTLLVRLAAEGLEPGIPVAAFLTAGGEGVCPPDGAATGAEAAPSVGEPVVALTTEGDIAPEPVVDVDRVPVVTDGGEIAIERTYDVAEVDPFGLEEVVLVGYRIEDPDAGIDEARPVLCGTVTQASAETAAPAPSTTPAPSSAPSPTPAPEAPTTAQVERTPVGGVAAGGGSTAGTEHQGLLALGGTALVGAAVAAGMAVRRSRGTR